MPESKPEKGETAPISQPVVRSTSAGFAKNKRFSFTNSAAFLKSIFLSAGKQNKKNFPEVDSKTMALTPCLSETPRTRAACSEVKTGSCSNN